MKRIQRQALLEGRDCLIVALRLHLQLAEKVQRIGIAGIDPGDLLERVNGRGGLAKRPVCNAEVVPGARALRLTARGIHKNVTRFGKLLAIEQCDPFVQARRKKIRVLCRGAAERHQSFGDSRLIQVGDAKVVEANGGYRAGRALRPG